MPIEGGGPKTPRVGATTLLGGVGQAFSWVPALGWLLGALAAVTVERFAGYPLVLSLGMEDMPALFGFDVVMAHPAMIPRAALYVLLMYLLPVGIVAWPSVRVTNWLAGRLLRFPQWVSLLVHLALLYGVLSLWGSLGDYRVLILKLTLIAIIVTLSLNVVNGYMGEFSCSHPGFMALGAYAASVVTVLCFTPNKLLGAPLLPQAPAAVIFPLALMVGGALAAFGALFVAIPSFRTRGDYLAIISLAFTFIVKSLIENLEVVGGARGFMGQPDFASLFAVFVVAVLSVLIINNFVRSTLGKALNAVRDDETAANAMTVNTRRTKMTAFLFSAFWAGVAGGLLAHVIRYVNPGSFGILKLSEVLAMVYLGGLNSVVGSIVGAVGLNVLMEALRPLEILKWIVIPVLLILVMIFRPTGLVAFREFNVAEILKPKVKPAGGVTHGPAAG
jgi:branched-chain amino acid transport system permease protein